MSINGCVSVQSCQIGCTLNAYYDRSFRTGNEYRTVNDSVYANLCHERNVLVIPTTWVYKWSVHRKSCTWCLFQDGRKLVLRSTQDLLCPFPSLMELHIYKQKLSTLFKNQQHKLGHILHACKMPAFGMCMTHPAPQHTVHVCSGGMTKIIVIHSMWKGCNWKQHNLFSKDRNGGKPRSANFLLL